MRTIRVLSAFSLVGALLLNGGGCVAADLQLVEKEEARAVIVLPAEPEDGEQRAADELREHLRRMTGAEVAVVKANEKLDGKKVSIFLGQAADPKLDAAIREKGDDPGAFALRVKKRRIDIRGLSSDGTLFGAYELLEQLGVRWFFPGDIGTVIPEVKRVKVREQLTVQVPSFPARWAAGYAGKFRTWQRRLRMGGPHFPAAHGIHLPKTHSFDEHPEYYALINGERRKRQLCVSNPQVVEGAVATTKAFFRKRPDSPWIGIGPHDGRGFCECEKCKALDGNDWDPFAAHMSMTDRYIWLFNQMLEGIEDEFPDKKVCFYSYASYNRPPLKFKPNPRIVPAFAPITLCRVHGLGNPVCPEKNNYYRWLIQEWGKILPDVYDRGYWFNLADPGFLFPMVHRIREQIPIAHELGITGWRVECLAHWGSELPSLYIAGKLMWNRQADVDALLQDFYQTYFGPAAEPMSRYYELIDTTVRDADFHTGSSYDIPNLYPPQVRAKAREHLNAAAGKAGGVYADRVRMMTEVFDYTDAFTLLMERRAVHDWTGTKEALGRLDALREKLASYETQLITKKYAISYLKRFFRPCTEQGIERALEKGALLAGLDDTWAFKADPERVGEPLGWFSEDLSGGNWRTLKTSTLSWSDQDLRYFKGEGWYRQRVVLPKTASGGKILLWLGGVDELATVWVNGKRIGDSSGRAFKPFEMDVTESARPGKENLVAVRVRNAKLNELGTGGITAPVFFWTPKQADHKTKQDGEDVTPTEFK